ncbi:MAG: ABC transporter ATP-binding protein, partial [Bacillota bacterium]
MKNKPTNTMAVIARLWKYLAKYRVALILLFAAMILSNLLELSVPLLSGQAVDAIGITKGDVDFQRVFRNCGLMATCFAASS